MSLNPETCYRALASRDARFDGRFFVGVVTTGVYCRPVCPATTPRRENMRFFEHAAAAEGAGFRPCRRCHPETSPDTPVWTGSSATVSRALKLIHEGALDEQSVDGLAERLGVGGRHLRRLFVQHLGASPIAVAQARRIHFARKLLGETSLPIAEIAFAAGFSSVRRFNDAMRRAFGRPPGELRRARKARAVQHEPGPVVLRLPYRPPLDWSGLVRFLGGRAIPGVESVDAEAYRRTVEVDGASGWIEVRPARGQNALDLGVHVAVSQKLLRVVEGVRRIFDLGADPMRIGAVLRQDALLRPVFDAVPGLRVPGAWDPFELAVRAVLGQQVSVAGAVTIAGRLVRAFGRPLENAPAAWLTHLFPRPDALAAADLSGFGVPRARAETIREIARRVADGRLLLDSPAGLEETVARLQEVPGIGPWTAHYIALRALGEPDAFPASDLGLRRALATNGRMPNEREVEARAESWRPWRAYAVLALWSHGPQ
jgi:AraC family transcriptional regulator, regulatory protein of adaptative response / DNA-3-methyladenine glycosylase II